MGKLGSRQVHMQTAPERNEWKHERECKMCTNEYLPEEMLLLDWFPFLLPFLERKKDTFGYTFECQAQKCVAFPNIPKSHPIETSKVFQCSQGTTLPY